MAITLNNYCRSKHIAFIYAGALGLSGFAFNDFGDNFITFDSNGEEPKHYFIRNITKSCPGEVRIDNSLDHKNIELGSGDFVTFKDIVGMVELNDTPPRPIKVLSPTTFSIEDTSKYQEYTSGGLIDEVKIPKPGLFKQLSEAVNKIYNQEILEEYLNEGIDDVASNSEGLKESKISSEESKTNSNSESNNASHIITSGFVHKQMYSAEQIDLNKHMQNEKLHLAFLAVHEFFNVHNTLPHVNKESDYKECVEYACKIIDNAKKNKYLWALNLNDVDEYVVMNVAKWCRLQISTVCSFLGGIVSQEVIKLTGKYTPLEQWMWFDFFEIAINNTNNNNTVNNSSSSEPQYKDQIEILTENVNTQLKELKIAVIGCDILGNEIIKLLHLMGISSAQQGKLSIIDDNVISKLNLSPQFLFTHKDIGNYKSQQMKEVLTMRNPNVNINFYTSKFNNETTHIYNNTFWESHDMFILTQGNYDMRKYIDNKCTLYNKPLIDLEINLTKASLQVILPTYTSTLTDEYIPIKKVNINKMFPTSTEHCITWAKDIFTELFTNEIKELISLLNASETDIKNIFDSFNKTDPSINNNKILSKLERFQNIIEISLNKHFPSFVYYSIDVFQQLFEFDIMDLLQRYPSDLENEDGSKFWEGAKRLPKSVRFDHKDTKHFIFISTFIFLLAKCLGVYNITEKFQMMKDIVSKHKLKEYYNVATQRKTRINDEGYKNYVDSFLDYVHQQSGKVKLTYLEFNKNGDESQQFNFIMAVANIRAQNYKIGECDYLKTRMFSGQFKPAVGPVGSAVSGIAVMQVIHILRLLQSSNEDEDKKKKIIESMRNCTMNLGINLVLLTQLYPPMKANNNNNNNTLI